MKNRFTEEFQKESRGEFPVLKFASATYFKDRRELVVRFIISAFEVRGFGEDKQARVQDILQKLFPGVNVSAQYIRTYADFAGVKNKVLEFFNRSNQMVFRRFKDENLSVSVSDQYIGVELSFEPATYNLLKAADAVEKLTEYLDVCFNQTIEVTLKETEAVSEALDEDDFPETVALRDPSVHLINVKVGEKVYGRGKIAGISTLPGYIDDVKGAVDNAVLCGKIINLTKRAYKNKKYDENDPKSGPPELPLIRFYLDDSTSRIECVCFPKEDELAAVEALCDMDEIVAAGKVTVSAYNGALSYALNAIFRCSIDYDSITRTPSKPEPAKYSVIAPRPYEGEIAQYSLFSAAGEVPQYLEGKTFVIFDFEATSDNPASAEPIELSAARMTDGKITHTFTSLIKPSVPIPRVITELTAIDDRMVEFAPRFEEILPDFFKFTRGAVLVGHNIGGYDYPLLKRYADAEGYRFDNDLEDTLILSRKYLTELKNHRLQTITKSLGIAHENAHRAMADVLATAEVLRIIAGRMKPELTPAVATA